MSGIPWWTTDIGGFMDGDIRTDDFKELMVRWFPYGVFCTLYRVHGVRLPLNGLCGAQSSGADYEHGTPPMRPLSFDFPADPNAANLADQFMLGPDLLVAPVVEQGAVARDVYLPAGTDWTEAWTGQEYRGGVRLRADAPIERIPVFSRKGSPSAFRF